MVTKYLFQFGFFPWNTHAVLRRYENKPYFPPRILGVEKTDSYIKYDLVQLMALFFHRSQLLVSPLGRQPAGRKLPVHTSPTGCLAPRGKAGGRGFQGEPGLSTARCTMPASSAPSLLLQCYGLWDHEEDPVSKEHDRGSEKKGTEEEQAPLEPQTEEGTGPQGEPVVARALTQDHIQAEAGDGPPEPPVELKPRDIKRISLRFRKRRRESTEPVQPTATGMTALSIHSHPLPPWVPCRADAPAVFPGIPCVSR